MQADLETTWKFFSDPRNLAAITPKVMDFAIEHEDRLPEKAHTGMLIAYTVKPLWGIKMNWLTEIKAVAEQQYFIDEQRSGPYKFWYHEHYFSACDEGDHTLMEDRVTYAAPFGLLGVLANKLIVAPKLKQIFDYREDAVLRQFPINTP